MKYNGIELVEILPENWDGKSREMLVWDNNSPSPYKRIVVGYVPGNLTGWMPADWACCWQHCAEIPNEEPVSTNEESYITNNMTSDKIMEKFKTLRTELKHWLKNNESSNLLVNNLQYCIKTALNVTNVNKHLSEVVDFSKVVADTKKTRRMTNRELSDLLASGKAEKCYPYYHVDGRDLTKIYRTHTYYRNKADAECAKSIVIRYTGTDKWVEPLIEE